MDEGVGNMGHLRAGSASEVPPDEAGSLCGVVVVSPLAHTAGFAAFAQPLELKTIFVPSAEKCACAQT